MPTQKVCESWASTIRHLRETAIPADEVTVKNLQALLAALVEDDSAADTIASVQAKLDNANQNLADDQAQLEAFSDEYQAVGCTGRP